MGFRVVKSTQSVTRLSRQSLAIPRFEVAVYSSAKPVEVHGYRVPNENRQFIYYENSVRGIIAVGNLYSLSDAQSLRQFNLPNIPSQIPKRLKVSKGSTKKKIFSEHCVSVPLWEYGELMCVKKY